MAIAIVVPVPSRQLIGQMTVNKVTPENLILKLYANDYTPVIGSPSGGSTAANFTEAAGGGYTSKTLTGASWTVGDDGVNDGKVAYATQTWTFTGALTTNPKIWGIFFVQTSSGLLVFCGRDTDGFTPTSNGDLYSVTPEVRFGDLVA